MRRAHVATKVSHGSVSTKSFLIRWPGGALRDAIGDEGVMPCMIRHKQNEKRGRCAAMNVPPPFHPTFFSRTNVRDYAASSSRAFTRGYSKRKDELIIHRSDDNAYPRCWLSQVVKGMQLWTRGRSLAWLLLHLYVWHCFRGKRR